MQSSLSPKDVGYQDAVDGIFLLWLGARACPYSNHSSHTKNSNSRGGWKRCYSRLAIINFDP
jgi:hypothetical protein